MSLVKERVMQKRRTKSNNIDSVLQDAHRRSLVCQFLCKPVYIVGVRVSSIRFENITYLCSTRLQLHFHLQLVTLLIQVYILNNQLTHQAFRAEQIMLPFQQLTPPLTTKKQNINRTALDTATTQHWQHPPLLLLLLNPVASVVAVLVSHYYGHHD